VWNNLTEAKQISSWMNFESQGRSLGMKGMICDKHAIVYCKSPKDVARLHTKGCDPWWFYMGMGRDKKEKGVLSRL